MYLCRNCCAKAEPKQGFNLSMAVRAHCNGCGVLGVFCMEVPSREELERLKGEATVPRVKTLGC
jgi:hypothetical protein